MVAGIKSESPAGLNRNSQTVAALPQTNATIGRLEPFKTVNLAVKK
jgi:hypothetical protein